MKLSDYVADFLAQLGVRHVFAITGGASLHLIESLSNCRDIEYVCTHHEQASAMAADAYSRVTQNLGAALATSGPGGTNMITGICCSWYDSVPVLYITGQVSTFRNKGDTGVRQIGFQETDIVDMCKSVTKYAVTVSEAKDIRYELEKAVWLAKSGRPGPVLIDIPDDLQRADISPDTLEGFNEPSLEKSDNAKSLVEAVKTCLEWLVTAKRPVIVLGWGVRLAEATELAICFIERLGLPVNLTWAVTDMLESGHPLLIGTFGIHGTRYGNFAIQNADLVISIGSRLDTHMIGSPFSDFAREARKVMIDIDHTEVNKFENYEMTIDLPVICDAKEFLEEALRQSENIIKPDFAEWWTRIEGWKSRYPQTGEKGLGQDDLNPYDFVRALSDETEEGDVIISDTGCALAWLGQAFLFKEGQRFFHAFNHTPMGYALPASIGASLALEKKRIICVVGDGALMMNIQELNTVLYNEIPVKIFLLNNRGYSMIQQTQDQWLQSKYEGSSEESGLGFPDFHKLAKTLGFPTTTITASDDILMKVRTTMEAPGAAFCNVMLAPDRRVVPQVKFGYPLEDSEPLLERQEFMQNMIVEPKEVSRKKI